MKKGTGKDKEKFDTWDDRSDVKYTRWAPGEPNDGGMHKYCKKYHWKPWKWGVCKKHGYRKGADEDCAEIYAYGDSGSGYKKYKGYWNGMIIYNISTPK